MGRLRRRPPGSIRLARVGIGMAGISIGGACLLAPRLTARAAGLAGGPDAVWLLRLFGVRDVCLGVAFLRARDRGSLRSLGELMALIQVGDVAVSTLAAARGRLSRRALAAVCLGAPPTVALALRLILE